MVSVKESEKSNLEISDQSSNQSANSQHLDVSSSCSLFSLNVARDFVKEINKLVNVKYIRKLWCPVVILFLSKIRSETTGNGLAHDAAVADGPRSGSKTSRSRRRNPNFLELEIRAGH
jgi:hypothetical protein